MPFNYALAQQAAALCGDHPVVSPEYAHALGVAQNVLDMQLALLVTAAPNEPAAANLTTPDAAVTDLHRQRLRLELHCMDKGTAPVAQQRSLLRALVRTGTESLADLSALGDASALRDLVRWQGLPSAGYTAAQGWHGGGTAKNGEPVLPLADACLVALWGRAYGDAVERANKAAAAAAAAGPAGAPAPKIPFPDRLAASGHAGLPAEARPNQTMVEVIDSKRASTRRTFPYVLSKLDPWTAAAGGRGHAGSTAAFHQKACLENVGAQLTAVIGDGFDVGGAMAAAALSTATDMAAAYDPAGRWWYAIQRIVHSAAIAGCFGPGGITVATAYLWVLGSIAARHGVEFAKAYDDDVRMLAASSEEYTEDKVAALLSSENAAIVSAIVSRQLKGPAQGQQQQQPPRPYSSAPSQGGGGKGGGGRSGSGGGNRGNRRNRNGKRGRDDGTHERRDSSSSSLPPIIPAGPPQGGKGGGGRGGGGKGAKRG